MGATRLNVTVPGNGLPRKLLTPATDLPSLLETTAYDHWIFDEGSTASLTGKLNGRALTPVGSGHVYNSNSITLPGLTNTGLDSTMADQAAIALAAVVKWPSSAIAAVLFGAWNTTQGFNATLFNGTGNETRANFKGTTPTSVDLNTLVTPPAGSWVFLMLSTSLSGSGNSVRQMIGGFGAPVEQTAPTGTRTLATTNNVGLGSPHITSTAGPFEVAEFIPFASHTSLAFMSQVYQRSKTRMSAIGIDLL